MLLSSAQQPWVDRCFFRSFKPRKKWTYYVIIFGINTLLYFWSVKLKYDYKQRVTYMHYITLYTTIRRNIPNFNRPTRQLWRLQKSWSLCAKTESLIFIINEGHLQGKHYKTADYTHSYMPHSNHQTLHAMNPTLHNRQRATTDIATANEHASFRVFL